jgi:hypothetical protein
MTVQEVSFNFLADRSDVEGREAAKHPAARTNAAVPTVRPAMSLKSLLEHFAAPALYTRLTRSRSRHAYL